MAKNKKLNFPVNEIKDISDRELQKDNMGALELFLITLLQLRVG